METQYELIDFDQEHWYINGESTLTVEQDDAYTQVNGTELKYKLSGKMTTQLKLSRSTGWLVDGTIHQNISGTVDLKHQSKCPK